MIIHTSFIKEKANTDLHDLFHMYDNNFVKTRFVSLKYPFIFSSLTSDDTMVITGNNV